MMERPFSYPEAGLMWSKVLLKHWDSFVAVSLAPQQSPKLLQRKGLNIATVVAVSRFGTNIELAADAVQAVTESANFVSHSLERGLIIYGVNTGFGGSADTRSSAVKELQLMLIRGLHHGILSSNTTCQPPSFTTRNSALFNQNQVRMSRLALPLDDPQSTTTMPASWARASMLVRLVSLVSGVSGVKLDTVETLAALLNKQITPHIPLRGSISASGDLSPLGYIGGAMQGRPSVLVWVNDNNIPGRRRVTRADRALAEAEIKPVDIGPKEGLAIVNGTAVSAGVAALALHEAHCQAAICQVLTAMSVEALQGTVQSFEPFISQVRPHPGQTDCAKNIFAFLNGSELVQRNDGKEDMTLRQDRYAIRTAPQWIGPVLEDLLLADQQITIELNSVTDNPLIDLESGSILHGGNFQAKSVTSAMEKTRAALQTIGRMLFSQCTELINPTTNRGLPPNLVVDEPSTSFIWKGTDIMVAALASELGFLASPVAPHVQTAEMGNQALNSLALISARYTLTAVEVLTQLSSAHLMALCQAFDLRAMQLAFMRAFRPEFTELVSSVCTSALAEGIGTSDPGVTAEIVEKAWQIFKTRLEQSMSMNTQPRIRTAIEALQPLLLSQWPGPTANAAALREFSDKCTQQGIKHFEAVRTRYRKNPDASHLLGSASRRMYSFVRQSLKVPFFGEAEISFEKQPGESGKDDSTSEIDDQWPTVGGYITRIYEAMRSGVLYAEVVECFREVQAGHQSELRLRARLPAELYCSIHLFLVQPGREM